MMSDHDRQTVPTDPIVAEVRRIREEQAARLGFDVAAIVRNAQARQRASGLKCVRYPPRRIAGASEQTAGPEVRQPVHPVVPEKGRGLMVGIAVGNLLGIPYEFGGWDAEKIAARFPDGIREIAAKPGWPDDDDLAQSIILAEASVGAERYDMEDLARRFWAWAELNGGGMGDLTRRALSLFGGDEPRRELRQYARHGVLPTGNPPREPNGLTAMEAARVAWRESVGGGAGNGSVMRCAPVALRWAGDDVALVRNSVISAAVTHRDPRCMWAAVLVNLATARCLQGSSTDSATLLGDAHRAAIALGRELQPFGFDVVIPDEVAESVKQSLGHASVADLRLGSPNAGFVLKTMRAALWCVRQPRNFEDGLSDIVSAGGDTDTNGTIAGAVLGARFGLEGIPQRWREMVIEIRNYTPPVPNWARRERLESLADRVMAAEPDASFTRPEGVQTQRTRTPKSHAKGRLQVLGKTFEYRNAKDALSIILRQLQRSDPTFLGRLAEHPTCRGRTRRTIARTREALYPGRRDLQVKQSVELADGWFLATNSNNGQKMAIVLAAAETAGLKAGEGIIVDL